MSDEKSPDPKAYEAFMRERQALLDVARESGTQFAKTITTLAAAALGFSVTFLVDLAVEPSNVALWFLKISWILFATSLGTIVIGFFLGPLAFHKQVKLAEQAMLHKSRGTNPYTAVIKFVGGASLVTFLLGLASMVAFASLALG